MGRRRSHRGRAGGARRPRDDRARTTRLRFHRDDGDDIIVETTRPELLAACVALVAHPNDERYQPLFGTEVVTPLFGVRVPVLAHRLAEPEKGSGIAMICTFGDTTDVMWWRELQLPVRAIIERDGRVKSDAPSGFSDDGVRAVRRDSRERPRNRRKRASSRCCASRVSSTVNRARSRTR